MVHFDRLTRMADMVEREISRGKYHFNLHGWGCGTNACAIGLAVATGEFAAEGITRYERDSYMAQMEDGSYYGWDAVRKLFGIDVDTSHYFFSMETFPPNLRVGPAAALEVVRRIRAYVSVETETRTVGELIDAETARKEVRELEPV